MTRLKHRSGVVSVSGLLTELEHIFAILKEEGYMAASHKTLSQRVRELIKDKTYQAEHHKTRCNELRREKFESNLRGTQLEELQLVEQILAQFGAVGQGTASTRLYRLLEDLTGGKKK